MNTREIVDKYYEYANAGKWDAWCDLFTEDAIYDEQLAGRIEGREVLRGMMKGFPDAYAKFQNVPKHVRGEWQPGRRRVPYFGAGDEVSRTSQSKPKPCCISRSRTARSNTRRTSTIPSRLRRF